MSNWTYQAPVYVTRPTSSGEVGSYCLALWATVPVLILVWLNALLWSAIGIYEAINRIV